MGGYHDFRNTRFNSRKKDWKVMRNFVQNQGRPTPLALIRSMLANAALTLVLITAAGIATQSARAQALTTLYTFTGFADGGNPALGDLVLDQAGNLYGTAAQGGVKRNGIVFKVEADGVETVLYSFAGSPDGASPIAGLLLEHTESTFRTRDVVHSSFSYVNVRMIRTNSCGPPLARIISLPS